MSDEITSIEKERANQLAQAIYTNLLNEGYSQFMLIATNGVNGFYLGYPPNFADQNLLKLQIRRNLQERPELLDFLKDVISEL